MLLSAGFFAGCRLTAHIIYSTIGIAKSYNVMPRDCWRLIMKSNKKGCITYTYSMCIHHDIDNVSSSDETAGYFRRYNS